MPYNQNNPTANNATTAHSHSNSNSSASSQNVRCPLNLRLSLQHLLICFLNRPRKARATHHPPPTSPANGKPSHEPGLTEAPGGRRAPRNQLVTGSARASRTTKWQHGWQRASGRRLGTALDISEARAGTGGRSPARQHAGGSDHTGLANRCEGQDMRVLKLPAWPVAETRVKRSRKGERRGERMTTAGNRGGREGGGRIMRLGLSNQRRLRIAASKVYTDKF